MKPNRKCSKNNKNNVSANNDQLGENASEELKSENYSNNSTKPKKK